MDELKVIFDEIQPLIAAYQPPMVEVSNDESRYELRTNNPVEILGRKKPFLAFASLIIQSSYVGFYFMPVYTDTDIKDVFHTDLLKHLKGKSCFHIKKTSPDLLTHIKTALKIGFEKYLENGWV